MEVRAVLLDTDVFSFLFVTPPKAHIARRPPIERWSASISGKQLLISFQTKAELLAGAYAAGWAEKRLDALRNKVDAVAVVPADQLVIEAFARLTGQGKPIGHPLSSAKDHVGDRWIAACAISRDLPLLTGNLRHFRGAPGLRLFDSAVGDGL